MAKTFGIGVRPGALAAAIESGITQRVFPAGRPLPPTRQIALLTGAGEDAVRRDLNPLVRRGLLESVNGPGGGYIVAKGARSQLIDEARG